MDPGGGGNIQSLKFNYTHFSGGGNSSNGNSDSNSNINSNVII